jgi:wyosine [tRNA(Phe)-imidazoG37] synthetase (radical SAM superfamily)
MTKHSFVYGPVPSRRLGLSLGINIIPAKTCTLDCVYCQCGLTTRKTVTRESFFPVADIITAVRSAVHGRGQGIKESRNRVRTPEPPNPRTPEPISFLTFSGEGEPTLNKDIGRIIRRLKQEYSIPVAVITNSTFISNPQVRRDLYAADLVVPSLDAADQRTFARIDRCHSSIKVQDIIEGLKRFRRYYRGKMWLEIMLVKGVNDSVEHVVALRKAAYEIQPDRVQLNTVVRPPAEKSAKPMSHDDLVQIQCLFGPNTDIPADVKAKVQSRESKVTGNRESAICNLQSESPVSARILATVCGRPVTRKDLADSLGIGPRALTAALSGLVRSKRIKPVDYSGKTFYEPA